MTYSGQHTQIYNCTCCVCGDSFTARRAYAKYCGKKKCQEIRKRQSSVYHVSRFQVDNTIYKRECLRCDKKFKTKNKFIRLCNTCKKGNFISEDDLCGTGEWR